MISDDLTKEEIAALSLEMRCCYFLYPWNNSMRATTVIGWARNIGFCAYCMDDTLYSQSVATAEREANELIEFVKERMVPDYTHELTQFSWKLKQLDDKVESLIAYNKRKGALVDVIKTRDEHIEELTSANHALAADIRSLEGVRTKNRELSSSVDELETELNEMSREMSNGCVCSDCVGSQRLELLDDIEEIVNPIIKNGEYARPAQSGAVLALRMGDVCHTVIDFRRKHNIVG